MRDGKALDSAQRVFVIVVAVICSAAPGVTKEESGTKNPKKDPTEALKKSGFTDAERKIISNDLAKAAKSFHEQHYVHGDADYAKSKTNKFVEEATVQLQNNKPDLAIQLLTKAIAECDTPQEKALYKTKLMADFVRSQCYVARGVCKAKLKKFSEAEKDFTEAIRYCSDYATPYLYRSKALTAQNKGPQAMEDVSRASHLKSAPAFVYKSIVSSKVDTSASDRIFSAKMKNSEDEYSAKYYVDGVKGMNASAMEKCYWEGRKLMNADKYVPAVDRFTAGIIASEDPKVKALYKGEDMYKYKLSRIYGSRAFCHLMLKNWTKATDDLTKEIALRPNRQESYINRAKAYKELGKEKEAAADFAMAKILKPNSIPKFLKAN